MPKIISDGSEYGYTLDEWLSFSRSKRWRIRNPDKMKAAVRAWVDKNKNYVSTRHRKYELRNKYNMTEIDYEALLLKQNKKCAICGTTTPTGKWKVFAVDHCHVTGDVRGLLCNECNRGMGLLRDNAELLRKAADYLDNHTLKTKKRKKD